jgi:serine/threonine protein kinase
VKKHPKDSFAHGARILEIEGRFKLFVQLHQIESKKTKFKLLVNQSSLEIFLKKIPDNRFKIYKPWHLMQSDVYISPSFERKRHHYQVMKCLGENLFDYFLAHPQRKEELARAIVQEVEKIHLLGIIHADIKAENFCILEETGTISARLIDFDESFHVDDEKPEDGFYGTLPYFAPEFFSRLPLYIKNPKQFFSFKEHLQLGLNQDLTSCLVSCYQKHMKYHSQTRSLHHHLYQPLYGFLSLGEISAYQRIQLSLGFIENFCLHSEWRQQISQKSDIYALACILRFILNIPKTSEFFDLSERMLAWEPAQRFEFLSSSGVTPL